ncbi:RICIN domain-containing protein [Streptomyces sp. NPDC046985]|uniref:RICIN domain-containing protein n=1 Tax=Streptomyces sp. NPDC046985 TaxID=3155377 RepID=UPI00340EE603
MRYVLGKVAFAVALAVVAVLGTVLPGGAPTARAEAAGKPLATFKVLFLIYPHVRVPGQPAADFDDRMLSAAQTAASSTWPQEVADYTAGQVRAVPTVVVVPHTLTSNERYRRGNDPSVWTNVWPEDVPQDVDAYVKPAGRYDSVIVWDATADYHNTTAGGGARTTDAQVTWSTQGNPGSPDGYGRGSDMLAGTKHEWLHGLAQYYFDEKGLRSRAPQCADDPSHVDGVHCGEAYGYTRTQGGYDNWNLWYKDFLNGAISGGSLGLGPAAWAKGVPRARFGGPLDGSDAAHAIVGQGSGKCLDVSGGGAANGTPVITWGCHGGTNQQWVVSGDGTIRNPVSGRCLEVQGGAAATANGTKAGLWDCWGGANQKWTVNADGSIRNPNSGRCLEVAGGPDENNDGQPIQIWDCWGGANQKWSLR